MPPDAKAPRCLTRARPAPVVVLAGDVALKPCAAEAVRLRFLCDDSAVVPAEPELRRAAALLNGAWRVTILAGAGCAGTHAELLTIAGRLQAPVVHAARGKEFVKRCTLALPRPPVAHPRSRRHTPHVQPDNV